MNSFYSIFGSGAARAQVLDLVAVAEFVEVALECIRKRLTSWEVVTCGNAVSVADDNGRGGRAERKRCRKQTRCDEKSTER